MPKIDAVVFACEHASKRVPLRYRRLFARRTALLDSHRGWDPGALELARALARQLGRPLFRGVVTRLLVDLNRSLQSPTLFSEYALRLEEKERLVLLARYWQPYRHAVRHCLEEELAGGGRVLHFSVHSFTPKLRSETRRTDIGLLFDPARPAEARFCRALRAALQGEFPELRIDMNEPYSGVSDGLTTTLRAEFPKNRYLGVEFEVNQRYARGEPARWRELQRGIARALAAAL
ncbi:MAG: N-formylglutamate amidohydrolase [Planctomycetes bacterium]|nr:N-formylglutamate amidohydrolase [Planctomycetota bacterium]